MATNNAPTTGGGKPEVKQPDYQPPQGPKPSAPSPGLGGTNHGNCGTQGKR